MAYIPPTIWQKAYNAVIVYTLKFLAKKVVDSFVERRADI